MFLITIIGLFSTAKGNRSSIQKLMSFRYQTKWPIELWTLKQEMETDDDHAARRESFLLVQNLLL